MLARLSIRQKLTLLLVIPLVAVALVMVAFTAERIAEARSAGSTANTALAAREIGALIQTLQQERLLALGYLAAPSLQRSALVTQTQAAIDDAARLGGDPLTARVIEAARPQLNALTGVRRNVINRTISAKATYDAYRAANTALLEALRLGDPGAADAQGLGQLVALDALMRSNEEASSVGAIVVGAAVEDSFNATMLTEVLTADEQNLRRFRQGVAPEQASLVDLVEKGQAGTRIDNLVELIIEDGQRPTSAAQVSEALTAALTYTGLRRLAQDRIARDVATAAESRATAAETTALGVAVGAGVLFFGVLALAVTVSRSISIPLRRLTRAAGIVAELSRAELTRVADSDTPEAVLPKLASVDVSSADEIGELAAAVNRVQATAAMLLERQVTTRANVATMFANIARRTQNLVGRQLNLIDELERNEREPQLLERLYQLDHVATRLRRSADSLLVVSGTIDQTLSSAPSRLADVVRSALAEIEGYRSIELAHIADVGVAAEVVGDLRLLLAELLENATNFSPPGSPVQVTAMFDHDCTIAIVDHGLGMSPNRMVEENQRLIERERLDVAPTRVLGLFVVGRLARRHGLTVQLHPTQGRGVTATVSIPARLLSLVPGSGRATVQSQRGFDLVPPLAVEAIQTASRSGPFPWLGTEPGLVAIEGAPAPSPPDDAAAAAAAPTRSWPPAARVGEDTVAGVTSIPRRSYVDPANGGVVESSVGSAATSPLVHGGLTQRIPGTHLSEGVRDDEEEWAPPRVARDPDVEREEVNEYMSGFARGTDDPEPEHDRSTLAERPS